MCIGRLHYFELSFKTLMGANPQKLSWVNNDTVNYYDTFCLGSGSFQENVFGRGTFLHWWASSKPWKYELCCLAALCLRVLTCCSGQRMQMKPLILESHICHSPPYPASMLASKTQPCEHLQTPVIKTEQAQQQLKLHTKVVRVIEKRWVLFPPHLPLSCSLRSILLGRKIVIMSAVKGCWMFDLGKACRFDSWFFSYAGSTMSFGKPFPKGLWVIVASLHQKVQLQSLISSHGHCN